MNSRFFICLAQKMLSKSESNLFGSIKLSDTGMGSGNGRLPPMRFSAIHSQGLLALLEIQILILLWGWKLGCLYQEVGENWTFSGSQTKKTPSLKKFEACRNYSELFF